MTEVRQWTEVRILEEAPPTELQISDTFHVHGKKFWEVGETGWDLMIAWLAGPETLARVPDDRRHTVEVTEVLNDAQQTRHVPRTFDDQNIIDEEANEYLRDMGLPERPSGYRWFQQVPEDVSLADIESAVLEAEMALPDGTNPTGVIKQVLKRLYSSY